MKPAPVWIGVLAGALLLAGTGCRSVYYGNAALTRAEQSMAPVLTQLKDYTLYLKHNVNAAAIASLRGEAANIQADIGRLLDDMNASIAKADEFVRQMRGTR